MRLTKMDYKLMSNFLNGFKNVEHNGVIVLTANNLRYVMRRYVDWYFLKFDETEEDLEYFRQMWDEFFALYKDNYFKMIEVMSADYNPINNYDKNSTISYSQIVENTQDNYGEVNSNGTTTTKAYGYNSNGYSNDGLVESTNHNGSQSNNGSKTISEHSTTEVTSGNIGVMSTQDMMNQELEVRKKNVNDWLITTFCRQNLVHC